jgi:hypothetical protein
LEAAFVVMSAILPALSVPVRWMETHHKLSTSLEEREVLNRLVMDGFGWGGPAILEARDKYEKIENALDIGGWLVVGVTVPLLFSKAVVPKVSKQLQRQFKECFLASGTQKATPLSMPLEALFSEEVKKRSLTSAPDEALSHYGLKSLSPQLANNILKGKLFCLLLPDLFLMATKGQGYYWGKNWLTEKLSGRKGFVGEFEYAQQDYLDYQSQDYEKHKNQRMLTSFAIGFGSALTLPFLLFGLVKNRAALVRGVEKATSRLPLGQSQKLAQRVDKGITGFVKSFNYKDAICMSKWVLAWHTMFNWNITSMLSSRTNDELREKTVRTSSVYALYVVGDDVITGTLARKLNTIAEKSGQTILSAEKGLFNMPKLLPLSEILEKYTAHSTAFRLGLFNFWVGLLGATMAINASIPLLNNYFTYKKVMKDQDAFHRAQREKLQAAKNISLQASFPTLTTTPAPALPTLALLHS